MENEEKFSDDPQEQLRIENELLKLKLQAELGAQFGGDMGDIPPEVEQQFLQQIMAFQEHQKNSPMRSFRDYIGSPELPLAAALSEDELQQAWERLSALLEDNFIQLQLPEKELPVAARYDFVVKDLFPLMIVQPTEGQGWIFDYQEFHPDYIDAMASRTAEFMKGFFDNRITPESWYIASKIINPKTDEVMNEAKLIARVDRFHDLFHSIKNYEFDILETKAEVPEDPEGQMMGFVEGNIRYTVERGDRQEQEIEGPFKLYFQKTYEWWEVFSFHLHGFSWE